MQHEGQKGLGVLRWVFFLLECFSPPLFLSKLSIAHHPNYPKKHKSFVGFQVEESVGAWRCNKRNKKDLAFCEWFFGRRCVFSPPLSPLDLDRTPSQDIPATKSFVGFRMAVLVDAL